MSEFLSEDFYSGLPEAQPWYSMQGLTSPYGVYGLNRAGLLAQQNLPVTAAGGLNVGVNVDGQAIMDQVNQNLVAQGVDPTGLFAGSDMVLGDMERGPDARSNIGATLAEISARGGAIGPANPPRNYDPLEFSEAEIDPAEDQRPTEELGIEDSIFQILMETIIGEQGIPEGVSAEAIEAIRGDFGPNAAPEELQEIAIEIAEAGGFDEWLAQQPQGDPEDLFEPNTGLEPDTDFSAPAQQGVNLEDFQTQFPDLNVEEYEDGMYTDPGTGTVYVINIPPGGIPEETQGEGDGGSGDGAGGNGEGGEGQQGQEGQGETGQAGQTGTSGTSGTTDQTGETRNIPDYSDIGDPNYGDDRIPPGDYGVIDDRRPAEPGFQVGVTIPVGNDGQPGSSGSSGSGGGSPGMLSRDKFKFTPYTASVRGVNPRQVAVIGGQPQRQSIMGMFREYLT